MKGLGEAAYIFAIKIHRDRSRQILCLSKIAYIDKILKMFKMENSKRGFLPIIHGTILSLSQCTSTKDKLERMNGIPYASATGSIMYAMNRTRPDLAYAMSMVSKFQ